MRKRKNKITLELPNQFLDLCDHDGVKPDLVLRGFIADLCSVYDWQSGAYKYITNGSDERHYARAYYDRVGYPYWNQKQSTY